MGETSTEKNTASTSDHFHGATDQGCEAMTRTPIRLEATSGIVAWYRGDLGEQGENREGFLPVATMYWQEASGTGRGAAMHSSDRVWRERGLRSAVLAGDERAWQAWYDESFTGLHAYGPWPCSRLRDLTD